MHRMRNVLGLEHPDTLNSMGNFALTLCNQGRWKKAKRLLRWFRHLTQIKVITMKIGLFLLGFIYIVNIVLLMTVGALTGQGKGLLYI